MRQLSDMIRELSLSHENRSLVDRPEAWASQAFNQTCWALWMSVTSVITTFLQKSSRELTCCRSTCLAWHRLPILHSPTCNKPVMLAHDDPDDNWIAYPQALSRIPGHSKCLFDAYAGLMPYVDQTLHLLLEERVQSAPSSFQRDIESMYDRLERWRADLPSCLNVGEATPFQITFLQ